MDAKLDSDSGLHKNYLAGAQLIIILTWIETLYLHFLCSQFIVHDFLKETACLMDKAVMM